MTVYNMRLWYITEEFAAAMSIKVKICSELEKRNIQIRCFSRMELFL